VECMSFCNSQARREDNDVVSCLASQGGERIDVGIRHVWKMARSSHHITTFRSVEQSDDALSDGRSCISGGAEPAVILGGT
jgi:hypothetical protein